MEDVNPWPKQHESGVELFVWPHKYYRQQLYEMAMLGGRTDFTNAEQVAVFKKVQL